MARLTDNEGRLLGGLDTPPAWLIAGNNQTVQDLQAPAAPPLPPEYGPDEIVFALECSYGSLAYLTYSPAIASNAAGEARRRMTWHRDCRESVEDPDERHYCPACGGSYCTLHASPAAHDCASVVRRR